MKICWDNLENVKLTKNGTFRKGSTSYIEMESCEWCGEAYLTSKQKPSEFCTRGCANYNNLVGEIFDRLEVISFAYTNEHKQGVWNCICICGTKVKRTTPNLIGKISISCGCLQKEKASKRMKILNKIYSPRYNPNLTEEDRIDRRLIPGYKEWTQEVYKLDNYTCQRCGHRGGNLNAHHIEAYNSAPGLRTEISNGITLCKDCHNDFHHLFGRGNNTRAQLIQFLKGEYDGN